MGKLMQDFSKVTEVELIYKNNHVLAEQPIITTSKEAYQVFIDTWDMNKLELQEQFRMILLDHKNGVLGVTTVATGGLSSCLVDPKLVFAIALKARASGIILAHNHPSGKLVFSTPDKNLTANLADAGKLLDLPVLDHLLVTKEGYLSLADSGLMPIPQKRVASI